MASKTLTLGFSPSLLASSSQIPLFDPSYLFDLAMFEFTKAELLNIFSLAFFCVPTLNPEDFMVLNGGLLLSLGT